MTVSPFALISCFAPPLSICRGAGGPCRAVAVLRLAWCRTVRERVYCVAVCTPHVHTDLFFLTR